MNQNLLELSDELIAPTIEEAITESVDKYYPRVLIISKRRVTERDNSGASIGKWFSGWPRDKVAHIFSGGPMNAPSFFSIEYLFAGRDRFFGKIFDRLKKSSLSDYVKYKSADKVQNKSMKIGQMANIRRMLSKSLILSGLWELLFPPVFSHAFLSWVREFNPDIIYSTASDLSFMRITRKLSRKMKIPICIQMSDDFPQILYRESPFATIIHSIINNTFTSLVEASSVRWGTGETMKRDYEKRYGVEFTPLMLCDEPQRFRKAYPKRIVGNDVVSILYSGELFLNRWQSLADVAEAAQSLCQDGYKIRIDAFVPTLTPEAENKLRQYDAVVLHDALPDSEVPATFKGADILLLPEGFDPAVVSDIRLSISSKSHLYMMCERPIFVYGPVEAGVVEYAKKEGWGFVVSDRDVSKLREAIIRLAFDQELKNKLVERSRSTFRNNHDVSVIREKIRSALLLAMQNGKI